jgi:hypothetical protein
MKGVEPMKKQKIIYLTIGIIFLITGIIMAVLHIAPTIIAFIMIFSGAFLITFTSTWFWMRAYNRDGALIIDEMVKRVDALSGNYTFIASLFFIYALGITNYFYPLPLNISDLLIIMIVFMSLSYIFIRFYILKRGTVE